MENKPKVVPSTQPAAEPKTSVTTTPIAPPIVNSSIPSANISNSPESVLTTDASAAPMPQKLNIPKIDPKNIVPMFKEMPLKFKVMAGVVITLVILLILASFTAPGKKVVQQLTLQTPSPIPSSSPIGEVFIPSPYATDPEVLDLESNLLNFNENLSKTTLSEDTLRPPTVDWNIQFK